jgi:hypothetical protein
MLWWLQVTVLTLGLLCLSFADGGPCNPRQSTCSCNSVVRRTLDTLVSQIYVCTVSCRLLELLYEATPDKQQLDAVVAALPGKHGNIVKLATNDARELAHAFPGNEVSWPAMRSAASLSRRQELYTVLR